MVKLRTTLVAISFVAVTARAQVVPAPGYIYEPLVLDVTTQNCVAPGPRGTFVGTGRGFTANAQNIVLVRESGRSELVAFGFSSIGDCAYDPERDILYVSDNADNADLGLTTGFAGNTGAQSGDTVFAIPDASRARGLFAADNELLPADAMPTAANVAVLPGGDVLAGDATGAGAGSVFRIDALTTGTALFATGFDFTGGIAVQPSTGDVFVADTLGATFESRIRRFDSTGTPVGPDPFAGPAFSFGSFDLAFDGSGRLLATGLFGGDVVAFDPATASTTTFAGGLTFATGVATDPVTGRVEILSSTFTGAEEDRTIHRFVPVDRLLHGRGSSSRECLHELYGTDGTDPDAREIACTDGDPCDDDGTVNGSCLFPVGFCVNVPDPDFPNCGSAAVDRIQATVRPADPDFDRAVARANAALPATGPRCFFTDGVEVPVRARPSGARPGKGRIKIRASAPDRSDVDVFRLVCRPAP